LRRVYGVGRSAGDPAPTLAQACGSAYDALPARSLWAKTRDGVRLYARARLSGAGHVFLIGSSMGGAAIVQNTSALRVEGRVSLSGTRLWPGYGINSPAGVARIRDPFLYVGTRDDWNAPVKEALGIFRRVGARDKRTAFYPGSAHGWDIIERSRVRRAGPYPRPPVDREPLVEAVPAPGVPGDAEG
jgi:dienelactone hydrolase